MKITFNTDVNDPCSLGEVVAEDGRTILVSTDWDYPGFASTFGWNMRRVQREEREDNPCHHDHTDGTVDCKDCGLFAGDFIADAYDFLTEEAENVEVEDPGYFD